MVNARARREGLKTPLAPARVAGLIAHLETHRRSVDSAETDNCSLVIGVFELANSTRNGLGAISGHHVITTVRVAHKRAALARWGNLLCVGWQFPAISGPAFT